MKGTLTATGTLTIIKEPQEKKEEPEGTGEVNDHDSSNPGV
jgi:hypothetical protein